MTLRPVAVVEAELMVREAEVGPAPASAGHWIVRMTPDLSRWILEMTKWEETERAMSVRNEMAASLPGLRWSEDGAGRDEVGPSEAEDGPSDPRWGSTMHWWLVLRKLQLTGKR